MKPSYEDSRAFVGRIVSVDDGEISFEDKTRGIVKFTFDDVAKANLRVDLEQEFKKRQ